MEGLGRCHFRLGWQGRSSLPKHSRMSDNPPPSPPPPETRFTLGQTAHTAPFPRLALQVWGVHLSLSPPPRWAKARTCYLPGQGGFPQMTVLASRTLSKLFFCTCLPEPPFLTMLSVKDSVPLHVPRHPPYGSWYPNAWVSSPLRKAQGCKERWTSLQQVQLAQRPHQTNQDWVSSAVIFQNAGGPCTPVSWVPSAPQRAGYCCREL